ncbi:MAG: hypothetical protein AB4058_11350 [Microcystaceae cyanobacterium]
MKWFLFSLCLSTVNLTSLVVTAQDPPAQTYQPGFWQPVARVDLNRPITLNLINETGLELDYAITNIDPDPIPIAVNVTETLENVSPELYIVLYPTSNNPNSSRIALNYQVEVTEDNRINVRILTTEGEEGAGDRSINLQATGAIYIY